MIEARAITPSGTPTPAPIAVSREVLEPQSVGTGVLVLEGLALVDALVDDFAESPATPGIAVPLGMLTDLKLPQSTVPFSLSKAAVPQQWVVLLPLYCAATIGKPESLL
jgi:hypothetical protein